MYNLFIICLLLLGTLILYTYSTALCNFKSDISGNNAGPGNILPSILIEFILCLIDIFLFWCTD